MIFFSVADACRHLGIDPKTLHRWLAHAHLSLQAHPGDARKHGLSEDDLRQLARLHQRALPLLPALPPAPLSAELLALPQTLNALHAQLTALQQQVADLTHLLQPHIHPPAPAPQAKAAKQTPTPAAPRSRRAAAAATTPPRQPVHVLPRVEWGGDG